VKLFDAVACDERCTTAVTENHNCSLFTAVEICGSVTAEDSTISDVND